LIPVAFSSYGMTNEICSVTVRLDGEEYIALVETTDADLALKSVLDEGQGKYSKEHCTVLRLDLQPGAELPIGFFWRKGLIVWLDDWSPISGPISDTDE